MPLLSVVIPVYNVQAYLEECLDSVLDQGFRDLEVIAVDDGSPDHSDAILDDYAARDDRLRVIHLEENAGLGPARNVGLDHAAGEYVLFLDSDDSMTPASLHAIAGQLEAMGRPDVLLLDHARTYWWGEVRRNLRHALLEELSSGPFKAEDHPEVFGLLQVAWNKVCRRDFLLREQLTFPSGLYEDIVWTHRAILTAGSIGALDVVCVLYRQRRHGSILGTASGRHAEVFDQWEQVFAFLDGRPDLAHWGALLSERMAHHYLTVLRHPQRLAATERADFFARASADLRRYGQEQASSAHSRSGTWTHSLLYRGDLRAFDAFIRASRTVSQVKARRQQVVERAKRLRRRSATAVKQVEYRRLLKAPLDPHLAIFASLWNRGAAGNPLAIYRAMQSHAPQIHGVWVIRARERPNVPPGMDFVVPGSRRYWQLMARATYFINDVNFPDDLVKRPGQVHVQTQHGTPLKHMGLDLMQHPAASKGMVFRRLLARSDRWDYNLSANRFSTLVWERAFPSRYTTLESGYPRNDALVNATQEDVLRVRAELGVPGDKTVVLFAPTHRDHDKQFILRADLNRLSQDLGPDFVILVRAHYFYRWLPELDRLEAEGRLINVSRHGSVESLMIAADVLVTDYSSIMFDYANLDRPIVLFAPDWETYKDVRGVYFDIFTQSPGVVVTSQDELAKVLTSGADDDLEAQVARAAFRRRFCEFDDGRAAERVVRVVFRGEEPAPIIPVGQRVVPPRPAAVDLSEVPSRAVPAAGEDGDRADEAQIERSLDEHVDVVESGEDLPPQSVDLELGSTGRTSTYDSADM